MAISKFNATMDYYLKDKLEDLLPKWNSDGDWNVLHEILDIAKFCKQLFDSFWVPLFWQNDYDLSSTFDWKGMDLVKSWFKGQL